MGKTLTTISLNPEVKEEGAKILKEKGYSLSQFVEINLRNLIKAYKGGNKI